MQDPQNRYSAPTATILTPAEERIRPFGLYVVGIWVAIPTASTLLEAWLSGWQWGTIAGSSWAWTIAGSACLLSLVAPRRLALPVFGLALSVSVATIIWHFASGSTFRSLPVKFLVRVVLDLACFIYVARLHRSRSQRILTSGRH